MIKYKGALAQEVPSQLKYNAASSEDDEQVQEYGAKPLRQSLVPQRSSQLIYRVYHPITVILCNLKSA